MRCRPKLSPARRRLRKYAAIILAGVILSVTYFELAVKAQLGDVIIREMKTVSVQAVNDAVDKFLSENFDIGEKLVTLNRDGGSVSAVTTNPSYINYVKTSITKTAQSNIEEMSRGSGVGAHLGSFTGLIILTNVGPVIYFDVESSQTITCEFESTFEGAGLNQTIHHITMTVTVELVIYNPFRIRDTVEVTSTYEIAQTVIVGSVPSYSGVVSY